MLLDHLLAAALDRGRLPPHAALDTPRRACVAIVLRLRPPSQTIPSSSPPRSPDLAAFREWYAALPEPKPEAEVLFIRRAVNPRDRWSGQVAFPGGRNAPGEDDRSCVEREFREELGVELGGLSGRFQCLGRLDDRLMRTRTPFAVSTFVYLQMDVGPTEFRLAASEVAEAFWCPASVLCGPRLRLDCLSLTLESLTVPASAAVRVARLLGVRTLFFPCVYLQSPGDPTYALWGLSFGIVSDLLRVLGLPSFAERRAAELSLVHPGLSRQAALPFLTDSRIMNALLPAYFTRGRQAAQQQRRVLWVVGGAIGAVLVSMGFLASQRRARL